MSYRKKDIFSAIILMIFIISFAVVFTVFFKPLYYFDIDYLDISQHSQLDFATIKENYDILINYQSIFYRGSLNLPDFIMSTNGKIHFEEVKIIFEVIQITMVISGIVSISMILKNFKIGEYRFLKLTGMLTLIVPTMLGFVVALDFNQAFIIFHQLVFRNDYWIFDYRTDPVITILPEAFFGHCFMMIVFIIIVLALICLGYFAYQKKQILSDYNVSK